MRLDKGQRVRINFTNQLPQESIIHWHGLHVPTEMDGHPRNVITNGESYTYEFEMLNRAGTYWYHPHPHGRTGPQVYAGMAGFLLVSDDEERALGLPDGEFDIPLVIQDRTFNSSNQLVYGGNGMMDQMTGFLGNQIFVNGQPNFNLSVSTRAYRLRLLNGSNSRIYKLAWDDGTPLTVIGNDGGLLKQPTQYPYITMGPGERVELWMDFSDRPVGSRLVMQNWYDASSQGMMGGGGGGGGMMGGGRRSSSVQGGAFPIFTVSVDKQVNEPSTLPSRLSTIERIPESEAITTRRVNLRMQPPGGWTLNGRTFEMTGVASDEQVRLGTTEIWEFVNRGGMMSLPHPIHMHGEQFQVLDRAVNSGGRRAWEAVKDGYVDGGWKDTVLVMPGERVRVLRRFADFTGLFLYHCHNLEHEDMGMMRNFEIVA
jgi:FtsP/CotA-like multicopper oxidase with cupredoxin domain